MEFVLVGVICQTGYTAKGVGMVLETPVMSPQCYVLEHLQWGNLWTDAEAKEERPCEKQCFFRFLL